MRNIHQIRNAKFREKKRKFRIKINAKISENKMRKFCEKKLIKHSREFHTFFAQLIVNSRFGFRGIVFTFFSLIHFAKDAKYVKKFTTYGRKFSHFLRKFSFSGNPK